MSVVTRSLGINLELLEQPPGIATDCVGLGGLVKIEEQGGYSNCVDEKKNHKEG